MQQYRKINLITKSEAAAMQHIMEVVNRIPINDDTQYNLSRHYQALGDEGQEISKILSNPRVHRAFKSFYYIWAGFGKPDFLMFQSWKGDLRSEFAYLLDVFNTGVET